MSKIKNWMIENSSALNWMVDAEYELIQQEAKAKELLEDWKEEEKEDEFSNKESKPKSAEA